MKKIIALVAVILCFNALALTIDMNLKVKDETQLKSSESEKDLYVRSQSVVSGSFSVTVTENGDAQSVSQEMPPQGNFEPTFALEILGDRVRLVDRDENIDQIIPAVVSKTFFGNLKGLKISKEALKVIYGESLRRNGLSLLSNLGLHIDGVSLETGFDFTDMDCIVDKKTKDLLCNQSAEITINATDE